MTDRLNASLLKVTSQRLGDTASIDLAKSDLCGRVAVSLFSAHLRNDVGAHLHNRQGNDLTVVIPCLGHAELAAK